MSHRYSTTIRMGAAHFDISFGGQRVDLAALLYGQQPHGEQHRILREASAAVCKLHGIEAKVVAMTKKRVTPRKPSQPRTYPGRARIVTSEATL